MEDLLREHGLFSTVAASWSFTVAVPAFATTRAPLRSQSSAAEPGSDARARRRRVAQGFIHLTTLQNWTRTQPISFARRTSALDTDERARFGSGSSSSTLWLPSDRRAAAELEGPRARCRRRSPGRRTPSRRGRTRSSGPARPCRCRLRRRPRRPPTCRPCPGSPRST